MSISPTPEMTRKGFDAPTWIIVEFGVSFLDAEVLSFSMRHTYLLESAFNLTTGIYPKAFFCLCPTDIPERLLRHEGKFGESVPITDRPEKQECNDARHP
jgi:hypothetical protein